MIVGRSAATSRRSSAGAAGAGAAGGRGSAPRGPGRSSRASSRSGVIDGTTTIDSPGWLSRIALQTGRSRSWSRAKRSSRSSSLRSARAGAARLRHVAVVAAFRPDDVVGPRRPREPAQRQLADRVGDDDLVGRGVDALADQDLPRRSPRRRAAAARFVTVPIAA